MGVIGSLEGSIDSPQLQGLSEQCREFGMGLEASLGRIASRLEQIRALLRSSG